MICASDRDRGENSFVHNIRHKPEFYRFILWPTSNVSNVPLQKQNKFIVQVGYFLSLISVPYIIENSSCYILTISNLKKSFLSVERIKVFVYRISSRDSEGKK